MVRTLLFSLLAIALAHADDQPLSLRTLATDKGDIPAWHVRIAEEKFEKIEWPDSQPSASLKVLAGKELQLYEQANKDGETMFKPSMKVAIPEGAKEILLLASFDGENEELQIVAIPDRFLEAKANEWLVVNRSERMVNLRFGQGNDAIELQPGVSGIYQIKQDENKGSEVIAEAKVNDEMRKIYSTFWSAPEKQRSLVLFYDKDKTVKVRRIIDFLPVQEQAE